MLPSTDMNNSLLSYICLGIIFLLRILFSGLSHVLYKHFVLHFFSKKELFHTKIMILFQAG